MLIFSVKDLSEIYAGCMSWQFRDGGFCETNTTLPPTLGEGYLRTIRLSGNIHLMLSDQRYAQAIRIDAPEEDWPLEFVFTQGGGIRSTIDGLVDGRDFATHAAVVYMPSRRAWMDMAAQKRHQGISVKLDPGYVQSWLVDDSPVSADILQALAHRRPLFLQRVMGGELQVALNQMLNCTLSGAARRIYLESKAMEMVALFLDFVAGEARTAQRLRSADLEKLRRAQAVLIEDPANPPALKELARQVGLNDFKLKSGFKSLFGTTVFGYVREQRMQWARALLEAGNTSVTEVALEVGYSSLGHFVDAFKSRFGVTPGRYQTSGRRKG